MFSKSEIKQRIADMRAEGIHLPSYNLMCFIVDNALLQQTDKTGISYAYHTNRVSLSNTKSKTKHVIKKGHDLIEDSHKWAPPGEEWTFADLREVGFKERVIEGIDGMTHRDGEPYFDSIERASLHSDSRDAKLDDLTDNLNLARNNWIPTMVDLERWTKYIVSYNYLVSVKRRHIEPGTPMSVWMAKQDEKMQSGPLLRQHSSHPDLTEEDWQKSVAKNFAAAAGDDDLHAEKSGQPVPGTDLPPADDLQKKYDDPKP